MPENVHHTFQDCPSLVDHGAQCEGNRMARHEPNDLGLTKTPQQVIGVFEREPTRDAELPGRLQGTNEQIADREILDHRLSESEHGPQAQASSSPPSTGSDTPVMKSLRGRKITARGTPSGGAPPRGGGAGRA